MSDYYIPPQPASTHPAFREMAQYVLDEHLKRREAIDKAMEPARLRAWEIWNANLPDNHERKNVQPWNLLKGSDLTSHIKIKRNG